MKYLTPKLKKFYQDDFTNNVLTCTYNTWELDKGLKDILININKNPNVQTLFSRRYNPDYRGDFYGSPFDSYLNFAVSEKIGELKIKAISKIFEQKFPSFFFKINEPMPFDMGCNVKELEKMACIGDKNYFNNTHVFCFVMESEDEKEHENFWNDLNKILSDLK